MGKVAVTKMNILPKFNFLFQNLPILAQITQIEKWQKEISKFIWSGHKARIKQKTLTDKFCQGGCALPNLKLYYLAACLNWLEPWFKLKDDRLLTLEGIQLNYGYHAFLWYNKIKVNKAFSHHYVRNALMNAWTKIKKMFYYKIPPWTSPQEAFFRRTKSYKDMKWMTYKDILNEDGKIKTLEQLKDEVNLNDWYLYRQLLERYRIDEKNEGINHGNTELDHIIFDEKPKHTAKYYKILLNRDLEQDKIKDTMLKWAAETGRTIDLEVWERTMTDSYKYTLCQNYRENFFKMLHHWHISPNKLNAIYKTGSSACWKCQKINANYIHVWWECKEAKKYWQQIHQTMIDIFQIAIPWDPLFFLLNMIEVLKGKISQGKKRIMLYMLTSARITFAKYWKSPSIPTLDEWLNKLYEAIEMDMLTKRMRDKLGKSSTDRSDEKDWWDVKKYIKNKMSKEDLKLK